MVDTGMTAVKIASLGLGSALFFAVMIYIGSQTEDWVESASDFLVSGREINALIIGAGIAAIGLAGSMVSAVPKFAIVWGYFPAVMYLLAWCVMVVVFGYAVGPIIRRTGVYTTSEWMEQRFDRKTRIVAAFGSVLAGIGVTSAQFVGMGAILASITQLPFWQTSLAITAVTLAYMYLGGLWAVTLTDFLQVIIGVVAIVLLNAWLAITYGSGGLLPAVPSDHLSLWGPGVIKPFSFKFISPVTWLVGWGALIFGNQYYWIRIVSARSEKDAKRGPAIGALITGVFFTALLALPGLYALGGLGSPDAAGYDINGIVGVFIAQMPPGLDAFVLVALIAALMSTASTTIIGTSSILLRDIWEPMRDETADSDELVWPSRVFTVLVGFGAWLWAATWTGGAGLMLALGWAFISPLAAIFLLGLLWPRLTSHGAFAGVVAGILGVMAWQYGPLPASITGSMHATWVGIGAPFVVSVLVSLVTEPPYYGTPDWRSRGERDGVGRRSAEDSGVSAGTAPQTDLQEVVVALAKPATPSERWNAYVEARGDRRGVLPHVLGMNASEEVDDE
jgi:SSS family solute:Na+ symporter